MRHSTHSENLARDPHCAIHVIRETCRIDKGGEEVGHFAIVHASKGHRKADGKVKGGKSARVSTELARCGGGCWSSLRAVSGRWKRKAEPSWRWGCVVVFISFALAIRGTAHASSNDGDDDDKD